jgi:hypothetical protein
MFTRTGGNGEPNGVVERPLSFGVPSLAEIEYLKDFKDNND